MEYIKHDKGGCRIFFNEQMGNEHKNNTIWAYFDFALLQTFWLPNSLIHNYSFSSNTCSSWQFCILSFVLTWNSLYPIASYSALECYRRRMTDLPWIIGKSSFKKIKHLIQVKILTFAWTVFFFQQCKD